MILCKFLMIELHFHNPSTLPSRWVLRTSISGDDPLSWSNWTKCACVHLLQNQYLIIRWKQLGYSIFNKTNENHNLKKVHKSRSGNNIGIPTSPLSLPSSENQCHCLTIPVESAFVDIICVQILFYLTTKLSKFKWSQGFITISFLLKFDNICSVYT